MAHPGVSGMVKAAGAIGMSALSAFVACGEGMVNLVKQKGDQGKHEPGPQESEVRDHDMNPPWKLG